MDVALILNTENVKLVWMDISLMNLKNVAPVINSTGMLLVHKDLLRPLFKILLLIKFLLPNKDRIISQTLNKEIPLLTHLFTKDKIPNTISLMKLVNYPV